MINVIYKTSDGKEYQKKEDAIYHETYYQRSAYEGFSDGLCYNDIRANEFDASYPVEVED